MAFWDKVKRLFGGGDGEGGALAGHDPVLARAVEAAIRARAERGSMFEAVDIADEVTAGIPARGVSEIRAACTVVEALFQSGALTELGYARSGGVYHPQGADPAGYTPRRGGTTIPPPRTKSSAPPPRRPTSAARPATPPARREGLTASALAGGDVVGLSADELRKRALKIRPRQTAWIGRIDTIPPQSDERTALIDRGLVLRGLLTPEQIAEIHRVGDLWLRHHEAAKLVETAARASADQAIAERRAARAANKAEKRREATEKRAARIADVQRRRAEDIVFLGRGVSAGLADRRAHVEELSRRGLPLLATPTDVARALGISVPRLRWLAFHADAATRTHYVYFEVAKRSGGTRLLSAPHEDLKAAQRWILENVLEKLPVMDAAHGFVAGRSTVSNATAHVGRNVIVNCDLENFFPTITWKRVRGVFEAIGYSPAVATILALLCTEPPRTCVEHAELDKRRYWVAVGERALPQGAPTSPALSNQVARKLDQRLSGLCKKLGWSYTRYADDLTFSADEGHRTQIGMLLASARHIVEGEHFRLNAKKTRVQRAARRQEVTGVVVNDKPSLPREELRRLRAILHGAKTTGLAAQNRDRRPSFEAWLQGRIAYVAMIDPEKGRTLRAAFDALSP